MTPDLADAQHVRIAAMPADQVGFETLEIMSAAPRYSRWQFDAIARWLGRRVLEVGSGFGGVATHIAASGRGLVVVSDTDAYYRNRLIERFRGVPDVFVHDLTLPDGPGWESLSGYELDTAIAVNVLEHVEEHLESVRRLSATVRPGGRVILLVPAHPALFGSLDEELGHYRRYTPAMLREVMTEAGLDVEEVRWFNRVGALGWWLNTRARRPTRIPGGQLRIFDALVPLLRLERFVPLPFGLSLIGVGRTH